MPSPGGTPQATAPGGTESDKAAGPTPASYSDRLAEAERNVLSMALLWLHDQTVSHETLADVIEAYADVLDSQERNL